MTKSIMILSLLALIVPMAPAALACFPDADNDTEDVLFQTEQRGRSAILREDCQTNGLNPGSYFDEKGRIVGSPCDPVEYCSDRSSTDIAVIDYCSDSWEEEEEESQNQNQNPSPPEDCTHEGLDLDVCRPIEGDKLKEQAEESQAEDEPMIEIEEDNAEIDE